MRVLSLFDGISCGRIALNAANIIPSIYYASEVDKYAMTVAQANHPTTIQIGDVRVVRQMCEAGVFGGIDMLIAGSPCQNLSFAGKQKGLSTKEGLEITTLEQYKQLVAEGFEFEGQSYLFWEYVWIRELLKPTWWLLENVKMNKKWLKVFNEIMGVEGVLINSALVSAQNRQRYYWCNWPVSQPEDRGIYLRDIIETGVVDREKSYCIDANYYKGGSLNNYMEKARRQNNLSPEKLGNVNPSGRGMNGEVYGVDGKAGCVTTVYKDSMVANIPVQINPDKSCGGRQPHMQDRVYHPDGKSVALTVTFSDRLNVVTSMKQLPRGNNKGFEKEVDKSPSLTSNSWENNNFVATLTVPENTKKGSVDIPPECGVDLTFINSKTRRGRKMENKSNCLTAAPYDYNWWNGITYRKLTPVECERLQGLPDQYTVHVSNSQRYKMLGNGWQVDTIIHIFECLKQWSAVLGVKL